MAVAKAGYDSEYADLYKNTIQLDDLRYVESKKSLLAFKEGEGGDLSGFFSMIPSWLHLENRSDFEKYFDTLIAALKKGSLLPIVETFKDADWSDLFYSEFIKRDNLPKDNKELVSVSQKLASIYLNNIDSYNANVWPIAENSMRSRVEELNKHFNVMDYIAKWESFLGIPFEANYYEIVLCFSNKNGPDYNSLGYNGNLFYYDKPFKKTCQFLSHEIGTHLLIKLVFKLSLEPNLDFRKLYSAYENLVMFYNKIILGTENLAYNQPVHFNEDYYQKEYHKLYKENMSPEAMLRSVL
ncbi:MAG: hypothetical protein ABIJ12_08975 [bacterium]